MASPADDTVGNPRMTLDQCISENRTVLQADSILNDHARSNDDVWTNATAITNLRRRILGRRRSNVSIDDLHSLPAKRCRLRKDGAPKSRGSSGEHSSGINPFPSNNLSVDPRPSRNLNRANQLEKILRLSLPFSSNAKSCLSSAMAGKISFSIEVGRS